MFTVYAAARGWKARFSAGILKLDPHTPQGQDVAGPIFSWERGFLVGALLSAGIVADMLRYGWNAFPV